VQDYLPMLAFLQKMGVVEKTKRRALSQRCSGRMRRWCIDGGRADAVRMSRENGRYLFHVAAARDWMRAEGSALIADHQALVLGQGKMKLPPGRRKPRIPTAGLEAV
jgi:hypothetical protein